VFCSFKHADIKITDSFKSSFFITSFIAKSTVYSLNLIHPMQHLYYHYIIHFDYFIVFIQFAFTGFTILI